MGTWSLIATSKNDAKYANPTQVSPLVIPVPAGAQVGDVIDVLFQYGTPSTTDISGLAATDDAGTPNTYPQIGTTNYDSGLSQGMAAFRAVVADASAAHISISWTGNANAFIAGIAHLRRHSAGHITSDPLTGTPNKANQATPGTGTDAITSGTTTPLVAGALIVCYLMYPGSSPSSTTHGTSFTLALDDTATAQQASEWLEQAVAGAIAGTWTEGSAQPAVTVVFAFAPPAGGPVNSTLAANAGSYAVTGDAAAVPAGRKLALTPGTLAVTGRATQLPTARRMGVAAGSYAVSGASAVLRIGWKLAPAAGSYVLTGDAANLTASTGAAHFTLAAGVGGYSITGVAAKLPAARKLALTAGAYAHSGQPLLSRLTWHLGGAAGVLSIGGVGAGLEYAPAGGVLVHAIAKDIGSIDVFRAELSPIDARRQATSARSVHPADDANADVARQETSSIAIHRETP